jgi:hypothetical protein
VGEPWAPPRSVDLEVEQRDDAGADEQPEGQREERESQAVVLARQLGREHFSDHQWVDGRRDEQQREVGQRVVEQDDCVAPARLAAKAVGE